MLLGGFLFVLGLIVGSAINSFLWRYQTKTTFAGRSMCPVCKHQIAWYDNIPVLSWFLLSGKCRYCKKSISVQYPIVELITAATFMLAGIFSTSGKFITNNVAVVSAQQIWLNGLALLSILATTTILIMISIYDYKTQEIPNGFNAIFIALSFAYLIITNLTRTPDVQALLPYIVTAAVAFLFFYSLVFFSKETWMGGGDAKMSIGIGLLLGPAGTFLAIMIGSVFGSIYGLSVIGISNRNKKVKKKTLRHQIPFGPFLAIGTYLTLIFGPQIIGWYVKIILG